MLKKIISNLLDFIFPPKCSGCGVFGEYLCKSCFSKIEFENVDTKNIKHNYYDMIFACTSYHKMPSLKKLIINFKYKGLKHAGKVLSEIMIKKLDSAHAKSVSYDFITYVPMHPKREKIRVFNHGKILSKNISEKTNIKHADLLIKTINTEQQAKLSFNERLTNLNNSFAFNKEINITNKHILLIDDVSTTGATLNECSKVLKENGARKITVLVLAKTNLK